MPSTTLACTLGGAADGVTFSAAQHRLGMVSHPGVVGATDAMQSRSGIIPAIGTPMNVVALGTPAMAVTVKAGQCVVQAQTSSTHGVYTVTLTADGDITIPTADLSNPRIDLIVARVVANGTTGTADIFVLSGTPGGSPTRPALTSPPANTSYFPLAQVRVEAAVANIQSSKVTKLTSVDGVLTVPPGSLVPVANLTEAATLPLYTPFYSIADRAHGTVLAGGASLDGHQMRFIHTFGGATNSNGDCTLTFGVFLNGTFTAAPFPNGCFAAIANDCSSIVTVDVPLVFKQFGTAGPPGSANATFRVYFGNHTKYTTAGFDCTGIAWGW